MKFPNAINVKDMDILTSFVITVHDALNALVPILLQNVPEKKNRMMSSVFSVTAITLRITRDVMSIRNSNKRLFPH